MTNLIGLWRASRKRAKIRSCLLRIAHLLPRRYGKSDYYDPKQVREVAKGIGLPDSDLCYAYAAFSNRDAFDAHHEALGETCDYWQMRTEVGDSVFHGNAHFTTSEITGMASQEAAHADHGVSGTGHDMHGGGHGGHHG